MSANPSPVTESFTLASLAHSFLEKKAAHEADRSFEAACALIREHGGRLFTTPTTKGNARVLAIVNGLPCVYGGMSPEDREEEGIALGDTEAGDRAFDHIMTMHYVRGAAQTTARRLLDAIGHALPEVARLLATDS